MKWTSKRIIVVTALILAAGVSTFVIAQDHTQPDCIQLPGTAGIALASSTFDVDYSLPEEDFFATAGAIGLEVLRQYKEGGPLNLPPGVTIVDIHAEIIMKNTGVTTTTSKGVLHQVLCTVEDDTRDLEIVEAYINGMLKFRATRHNWTIVDNPDNGTSIASLLVFVDKCDTSDAEQNFHGNVRGRFSGLKTSRIRSSRSRDFDRNRSLKSHPADQILLVHLQTEIPIYLVRGT